MLHDLRLHTLVLFYVYDLFLLHLLKVAFVTDRNNPRVFYPGIFKVRFLVMKISEENINVQSIICDEHIVGDGNFNKFINDDSEHKR